MAQLISAAAAPFLTRLYRPEDFGVLAIFASVLSTSIVCSSLRYELAIPLPRSDRSATALATLSLSILFIVAAALALPIIFAGRFIASVLNAPDLQQYLWLLPLGVAGGGIFQTASSWAIRSRSYKTIAHTTVTQNVAMVGTQLVLSPLTPGALGLISGDLIGRVAGALRLVRSALRQGRLQKSGFSLRAQRQVAKTYFRYPLMSLPAALLNTVGLQLPVLVLAFVTDARTVGLFALTHRLLSMPLTLVGRSVGQVFFGEASAKAEIDRQRTSSLFRAITSRLFALALLPALMVAIAGPWMFAFAFGARWREAGVYAQLLTPVLVAQLVLAPVAQVLNITNHLERQLAWDLARLVLVTVAMMLGARVAGPRGAIAAYSMSLSVLYLILFAVYRHALRQHVYATTSTAG